MFPSEEIKTLYSIDILGAEGRDEILKRNVINKTFKRPLKPSFFIKSSNGRTNGPYGPYPHYSQELEKKILK